MFSLTENSHKVGGIPIKIDEIGRPDTRIIGDMNNRMTLKKCIALTCSLTALASCAISSNHLTEGDFTDLSLSSDGVFASDGYGYILDLNNGLGAYNISSQTCMRIEDGQENPIDYFDRFQLKPSRSELKLFSRLEPYPITFTKIDQLPDRCRTQQATDPLSVFDSFTSFYAEHYGFFDVQDVDWTQATDQMRKSLSDESSDMDVIERIIALLSQLRDGHVSVSAVIDGDEGQFIAYPGPTNAAVEASDTGDRNPKAVFGEQYLRKDIEQSILGGYGFDALNERMKYGITSDDIGYLAIMSEGGFTADPNADLEEELEALRPAMDQIIKTFHAANVKAVIIDLSVNHGGYDFLGREIARYFAETKTPAYSKFASDAQHQVPYQYHITPATGPRFTGPVYVMTSDVTVSAGETLTLALRALPNVTHVGAPTRGALSDVLTKYLPNGWEVTLSNEVYTDQDGIVWEGVGIMPEIKIEVFPADDPLKGHLPAVNSLVEIIDTNQSN